MKKLFLLIAAVAISHTTLSAQGCLPEGITFTTQAQIDSFQINYPGCTEIEGNAIICDNETGNISNLNGLIALTTIGGNLNILWSPSLTSIEGLNNITSIGGEVSFSGNYNLLSMAGLEKLTSIGGDLRIEGASALTSLTGLEGVISIEGNLLIDYNNSLASLTGLEGVTSIGGDLGISFNYALTSLTGLDGVTSFGGDLGISSNNALTSLTGLDGVTSFGGDLEIVANNSLTSLAGLEGVTSIGGDLVISGNTALISLAGLEGVTSIGGGLNISSNAALTSLVGLDNIDAGSINDLYININTSLSTCDVESVCKYLAAPGGTILIGSNAPGCNSPGEVEAACQQVGLENTSENSIFNIYPNPSSGQFIVKFYLQQPSNVNLVVHNSLGQVVATLADGMLTSGTHQVFWNSGKLPAGVYYCRLQAGAQTYTNKIIKIQ